MNVKTILWISHPAFSYSPYQDQRRATKTEINPFLDQLRELAETASKKEGTIVVLLKSFNFTKDRIEMGKEMGVPPARTRELLSKSGVPRSRTRKMEGMEKKLERNLRALFGTRLITVGNNRTEGYEEIQKKVTEELAKKRFIVGPKTRVLSVGSYKGKCTIDYPAAFASRHKIRLREMKKYCFHSRLAKPRFRR